MIKEPAVDDEREVIKKAQYRIRKEFSFLEDTEHVEYEFTLAQAKEICGYLNRVILTPFRSWEYFLNSCIEKDEAEFLNRFYLKRNEYGVLEPDNIRIEKMRL